MAIGSGLSTWGAGRACPLHFRPCERAGRLAVNVGEAILGGQGGSYDHGSAPSGDVGITCERSNRAPNELRALRVAQVEDTGSENPLCAHQAGIQRDHRSLDEGRQVIEWTASAWREPPPEGWSERAETVVVEARPTYSSRRRFARVERLAFAWEEPLTGP